MSRPNELLRKDGSAKINGLQDALSAKSAFSGPNENTLTDRYGAGVDPAGWRPIETAPKDGKAVLVFDYFLPGRDGFGPVVARFTKAKGWHVAATVVGGIYVVLTNPTHWMPLPPLPTPGGSDGR